jgi:type IV pilus assembly protein PilY1
MMLKKTLAWFLIIFLCMGGHVPVVRADDSDIFGQNVQPNVVILLDSSQSMNDEIPGNPYDPNTSYTTVSKCGSSGTSSCTRTTVYKSSVSGGNTRYTTYASSIANVGNADVPPAGSASEARDQLTSDGFWTGKIGGTTFNLFYGNYIDYTFCTSCQNLTPKITIAKRVVVSLLQNTTGVRFGVMKFASHGAAMVSSVGTATATMVTAVNNMALTSVGTPLGDALYDVGRYYKGTFPGNTTSPIQLSCQPNFVIVVTDGLETSSNLQLVNEATNRYTQDHSSTFTGTQNVIVHTVGFGISASEPGNTEVANGILLTAAANGHGQFYDTDDEIKLRVALQNAISQILAATFSFATPVVPTTGTSGIDNAYLAAFQSSPSSRFWKGFMKSYQRDTTTGLIPVDANGLPLSSALVWDAGDKLSTTADTSRTIYTQISGSRQSFTKTNSNITATTLGVSTSTDKDKVVDFIRGVDSYDEDADSNTTEQRAWKLGDIFHSTPVLVTKPFLSSLDTTYNTFKSNQASRTAVLLAGSNDGMVHAFKETNGVSATEDGKELWGFIPGDLLSSLQNLTVNASDHKYFVDASIIAADICTSVATDGTGNCSSASNWKTIAIFGERRGGKNYSALDITDTTSPAVLWTTQFTDTKMGETWSEPAIGKIKTSDGGGKWVAFIGGGYYTPSNNSFGKAFFVIDLATGAKLWEYSKPASPTDDKQYMNFSLAANPTIVDLDSDGFIDYAYIADVGGQVWKFNVNPSGGATISGGLVTNWTGKRIFAADSGQTNPPASGEYFPTQGMYAAPALALDDSNNLWLFIGSGDRNHPNNSSSNKFYGFKDVASNMTNATALTLSSLTNLSSGSGTVTNGWYVNLASNEKVLASAEVFNGVVLFTTFTPTTTATCSSGGGSAKLYSANMTTGDAALNLANAATLDPGGAVTSNGISIGTGIPSKPVIVMQMTGSQATNWAVTGTTNQQITQTQLPGSTLKQIIGWREVF